MRTAAEHPPHSPRTGARLRVRGLCAPGDSGYGRWPARMPS